LTTVRPLGACLLLAAAVPAAAQGFQLAPSSTTVLIGAPFEIMGTVDVPEGYSIGKPTQTSVREWEILDVGFAASAASGKGVDLTIRTAVFALGQQVLPALDWPLKGPGGSADRSLRSPEVAVTVRPPEPGLHDTGDIRDIKPPLSPPVWAWLLGLLAVLAAAGWAAHRYLRTRRKGAAAGTEAAPDNRTPEEIALDELESLPSLGLPVKDSYDRLSDILRLYLERRHDVPALSMTTHDLQRRLIRAELDPKARSLMKTLLDRCDLAKFARYLPAEHEFGRDCGTGKEIVHLLSPRIPEPPAPGGRSVEDLAAPGGRPSGPAAAGRSKGSPA